MKLEGIKDIARFCSYMNALNVHCRIEHFRKETMTVTITLYGHRIEIDFFDDHIEYSIFSGDESVEDSQEKLFSLIKEFVS